MNTYGKIALALIALATVALNTQIHLVGTADLLCGWVLVVGLIVGAVRVRAASSSPLTA